MSTRTSAAPTADSQLASHSAGDILKDSADAAATAASAAPSATPDAGTASALGAHLASQSHSVANGATTTAELAAPVGTHAWAEELGSHLALMAHRGLDSASLKVTPANLGPIEVRIDLHGSNASVWFGAAHEDTRAALEQSLPQLREMFANHGLSLGDAGVSRDPSRQALPAPLTNRIATVVSDPVTPSVTPVTSAPAGLLDLYA